MMMMVVMMVVMMFNVSLSCPASLHDELRVLIMFLLTADAWHSHHNGKANHGSNLKRYIKLHHVSANCRCVAFLPTTLETRTMHGSNLKRYIKLNLGFTSGDPQRTYCTYMCICVYIYIYVEEKLSQRILSVST